MILDTINRQVCQPFAAWRNRSQHLRHLHALEQSQWLPAEELRARQLTALQAILTHAFNTVPFYARHWRTAGVHPAEVKTLDDFRQFPVVSKADLRGHEDEFLSQDYSKSQLLLKRTSGSTGVPLAIYLDEPGKQFKYATTLRSDQWSGWRLGQRVAKVWGNPEYRHHGLRGRVRNYFLERAVYLDTVALTEERFRTFIRQIRRKPPGLIFGHAHSLYLLAQRLERDGIVDVRPQGVIATAMPLHRWQRAVMERVFGCKITDRYGCEEVSLIACECERHAGMHINSDSVYCEVDSGGEAGPLLVTDLTNRAMPLIRYRNGDVVTLSQRQCPCGRGLPMLEAVQGRDADFVVTPDGTMISGISLTENFALKVHGTAQMQIVQESVQYLRIRIVPADTFSMASRRQIAGLVQETFGDSVRHDVELVDAIEQEPSGKYRFCISKVTR